MAKYIVMAEEGERVLLDKAREQLGLQLQDATLLYTGVGAINIIRSLQDLDREAEIYNIGYAGSANFDLDTWVEVTEVRLNHPNVTYPEPELKIQKSKIKIAVRRYAIPIAISCWRRITKTAFSTWSWLSLRHSVSRTCIV